MPRVRRTVFLERGSYRRRRMIDALRLVAVLGAILWFIPVLWPDGSGDAVAAMPMSRALAYVFGAWLVLIVLAALLAWMTREKAGSDGDTGAGRGGRGA